MEQDGSLADDYERLVGPRFAPIARALMDAARPASDERVLEVGAGTGSVSRLVAGSLGPTGSLTVTDASAAMLAVAQRVLADGAPGGCLISFHQADLARLPVESGTVDLLLSQFTPLLDSVDGLAEARRVLRVAGRVGSASWGTGHAEGRLVEAARADAGIPADPRPDPPARRKWLRAAGFVGVAERWLRLPVTYRSVDEYLAFRGAFGRPFAGSEEAIEAYRAALARRAAAIATPAGQISLDWTVVILTAVRA